MLLPIGIPRSVNLGGAERVDFFPTVERVAKSFDLELLPIQRRWPATITGRITFHWRAWGFRRFPSTRGICAGHDLAWGEAQTADSLRITTTSLPTNIGQTGTSAATRSWRGSDLCWAGWRANRRSPENLTVSTATSATSLSMSVPSASYGDEQAVTFTSEVASTVGTPSGTVVVASGATTLCTITLPAISCSTTNPTVLGASTTPYSITATYGGGGGLGESTSGPQILTVDPAGSTTTISVSSSPVTYGNERTVTFTAGVTAQYGGTPTGTISVEAGTTPLCAITLPSTSCSASPVALDAATSPYAIQAFYSGDSNFADSTSGPESLTISKDTTTASVAESPTTVRYGGESASSFTVTVNTGNGEVLPEADSVTVNVGSGGSVASCSASVAPGGTGDRAAARSPVRPCPPQAPTRLLPPTPVTPTSTPPRRRRPRLASR